MNEEGRIDKRDIADLRRAVEIGRGRATLDGEFRSLWLPRGAAVVDPEFLAQLLDAWETNPTYQGSLGPGEDDAKVWIPPADDCMGPHPDGDCPHCGGDRWHSRTRRCGTCGRRP